MINKIKSYVNTAFENAPNTKNSNDLKEEMISNLIDKYSDLINSGKSEDEAYTAVISSIGNIDRLIAELESPRVETISIEERKKKAMRTAIAIGLYIGSPIVQIIFEDFFGYESIGSVGVLLTIAVATGLLVYNKMIEPKNIKQKDDLVEEFIEWKQNKIRDKYMRNSILSVLWLSVTAVYFIVSFTTNAWHISWVIFIVAAACSFAIDGFIKLRGYRYE